MSEYWKSTPKYWCKFCEAFVKDSKFDKQQHEATGKHQNAIQRNLRKLHNEQERTDREAQRAKGEVARLSALVSGEASSSATQPTATKVQSIPAPPKKATLQERKQQLAQLAAMGIQVPEEYRGEMAMAGEWQTLPRTVDASAHRDDRIKKSITVLGEKKRKHEIEDDEQHVHRKKGLAQKEYPSTKDDGHDIDALLLEIVPKQDSDPVAIKGDPEAHQGGDASQEDPGKDTIKLEMDSTTEPAIESPDKSDTVPSVVFKKRKKAVKPT